MSTGDAEPQADHLEHLGIGTAEAEALQQAGEAWAD